MPYLSNNYRHQPKPRVKSIREAGLFLGFSVLAIFILLSVIGVVTYAFQAEAAVGINQELNYQGRLNTIAGTAVTNGAWNFKFELYDSASG